MDLRAVDGIGLGSRPLACRRRTAPTFGSERPTRTSRRLPAFRCGAMVPATTCCRRAPSIPSWPRRSSSRRAADKVALVGIDLGRGPTEAMMTTIRREIADKAGIQHVLITGSHTHHGPVIELIDEPGLGKGKFDAAVAYSQKLPELLVESILAADKDSEARHDRRCDRVGQPEPQPAHQTRAQAHGSDAGCPAFRRPRRASRSPSSSTSPRTPS